MNFKDYSLVYRLENLMNYLWFLNELLSMLSKVVLLRLRFFEKINQTFKASKV